VARSQSIGGGDGINQTELDKICGVIDGGHSALVIGEAGSGIESLPQTIYDCCSGRYDCAIALYKGSGKQFFKELAEALDIPTVEPKLNKEGDEVGEKSLTVDQLKDEILQNVGQRTLLILPEAKRLPTSVRYWMEEAIAAGVRLVCFSPVNPQRDIFLDLIEIELQLPTDAYIRVVMAAEAQRQGIPLSESRLAELQPLAGRNPMLARKVIRREKLGIKQDQVEHTQYVVIMPILIAALFSFGIIRFIGMGTNNQSLYITGGICFTTAMALRQLGNVRGARKRLGQ
jgi:hypothetical protein